MKLLVILESHFFKDANGNVWCDRIIDYNYLKRYLNVFEEVIVCGRKIDAENKPDKFDLLVTGDNVSYQQLPDFYGINGLIKSYFKMNKLIKKYVLDVDAVIYRVPTPVSIFSYKTVLKANKPVAYEMMFAADKMINGNGFISKIINKIIDLKVKNMCKKANGVSYVTEKVLQNKYPCKALLDGESSKYFTENYSTIELAKEDITNMNWNKNNKPECFKIIHTGYMDTYRKGQDVLIKAVKKVLDCGYNVKLTLIGDGAKKSEFQELTKKLGIENYVEFTGLITDKKSIFERLKNSHIFVFPTEAEGLPRTIIEAMASGLPCLSSPVDGVVELLDKDFLIECKNVDGYANGIMSLIDDWDNMIKISENNVKFASRYERNILNIKRNEFYKKLYDLAK